MQHTPLARWQGCGFWLFTLWRAFWLGHLFGHGGGNELENVHFLAGEPCLSQNLCGPVLVGPLAVAGLGLGVSVVGFSIMLKRLKGIEAHLGTIEAKIANVTSDRRADDVRMIFADDADYTRIADGDVLEIDDVHAALGDGCVIVRNVTQGTTFETRCDYTPRQRDIVLAGGLLNFMASRTGASA